MSDRRQVREMEKVVRRVMKTVEKFDQIGKSEFEIILGKVMHQVEKNTGIDPDTIADVTPKVIDDMPNEYGKLPEEARSMEAMIGYLYGKYLKELGVLE
jgi:hypothetical protein